MNYVLILLVVNVTNEYEVNHTAEVEKNSTWTQQGIEPAKVSTFYESTSRDSWVWFTRQVKNLFYNL